MFTYLASVFTGGDAGRAVAATAAAAAGATALEVGADVALAAAPSPPQPATPAPTLRSSQSGSSRRSPGHYCLRSPSQVASSFETPAASQSGNSSTQGSSTGGSRSSGRYKLSSEKQAEMPQSALHLLMDQTTKEETDEAASGLNPLELVFRRFTLTEDSPMLNYDPAKRKEKEEDEERMARICESSKRRTSILERSGESKHDLLQSWKKKDEQHEEEKRRKFAYIDALVANGSMETVHLSGLDGMDELISYARRWSRTDEQQNSTKQLEYLKQECETLLGNIRALRGQKQDIEGLTALVEQRGLADRMLKGNNKEAEEMCSWLIKEFGKMRKKYVDECLENVDKFRKDPQHFVVSKEEEDFVAKIIAGGVHKIFESCRKIKSASVPRYVNIILQLLVEGKISSSGAASYAFFIFSLFRFNGLIEADCHKLSLALHARSELCIPSIPRESPENQPNSLAVVQFFALLVTFASYIPPSSVSVCRSLWIWRSSTSKRGWRTRLPVSLLDGRRWLVRCGRLLSQKLAAHQVSTEKERSLAQMRDLLAAGTEFLKTAGPALLCAPRESCPVRPVVVAFRKTALLVGALGDHAKATSAGLSELCERLLSDRGASECDDLFIMKQEPRCLLSVLEICSLSELCENGIKSTADKLLEQSRKDPRSLSASQRNCIDLLTLEKGGVQAIKDINLNANVDPAYYEAFLRTFRAAQQCDKDVPDCHLADYCLNHLIGKFWDKFFADTFSLDREPSEIRGILLFCDKNEMGTRDFSQLFRLYFFQRCRLLIPIIHEDDLGKADSQANVVGIFSLLMQENPAAKSPFSHTDGRMWLASVLSFWKRLRRVPGSKAGSNEENTLAKYVSKFLCPCLPESTGMRDRPAVLKRHYQPFFTEIRELVKVDNPPQYFASIAERFKAWKL